MSSTMKQTKDIKNLTQGSMESAIPSQLAPLEWPPPCSQLNLALQKSHEMQTIGGAVGSHGLGLTQGLRNAKQPSRLQPKGR